MALSSETPSTCVSSKQQKTPLACSFEPPHALNTSFYVYKTPRYVTMRIYFLQNRLACSFLVARNTIWPYCLLAVETFNWCSLFCNTTFKLQHPCHTSSICRLCPVLCLNIQYLPCKSSQFTTLFLRKTCLEYAVSCLQNASQHDNSSSNNTSNVPFLSQKNARNVQFLAS